MLKMNKYYNSLSDRFNKYDNIAINIRPNEAFIYQKSKQTTKNEFYTKANRSIDFLAKTTNIFDIGKIKEKSNQYMKNHYSIINCNSNKERLNKKLCDNFFINDKRQKIRRIILSKKKLLKAILDEGKKNNENKDKIINNNIYINNKKYKCGITINNVSMPEIDNKKYITKNKNGNEEETNKNNLFNLKNMDIYNKNLLQEKLYQIQMNKIALFKKIKYAGLKKFCSKGFNPFTKKLKINYISEQNAQNESTKQNNNKNELRNNDINNCNEITINTIRERVRNYFIGKFDNIKEYYYDWNENGIGKLSINDIYKYLNNKIKYRISKEEVKRLFENYLKKNYLDLESFKYLFFEQPSNEKISIQLNKILAMIKSSSEGFLPLEINKNETNLYYYDKKKYNDLINLIKENEDKILLHLLVNTEKEDDLNYSDFYNLINKIIPDNNKNNYENQIKTIFNNNKLKNIDRINIKEFFETINNKKNENKLNNLNTVNTSFNIKKEINNGYSTFYEKNCDNKNSMNNRNQNNIYIKKNNRFNKTNNLFYKENDFGEINNINKKSNLNEINEQRKECKSQERNIDKNKKSTKMIVFKTDKEKIFNEQLSKTHENVDKRKINYKLFPSFRKFQLPIITKRIREQNKNSDILELLK